MESYNLPRWATVLLCLLSFFQLTAQTQTIRIKPITSSDDAEQNTGTGEMYLTSRDLELGGYDWGGSFKQISAIRFPNVALPQGATITKAYIQFSVDEFYPNTSNTAAIAIKAQKGNAATYTFAANNISSRTYTTAQVNWATTAWTVDNQRLAAQQTPDIKNLITEAIQTGWASGNALAFLFSTATDGYATVWAVDRDVSPANVAELVIEYTTSSTPLSISVKIAASSDDAEETTASGNVDLTSSDLELGGFDYGNSLNQVVGVRFSNVVLPASAVISKAYIQFAAKQSSETPLATLDIKAQTLTNAPTFTSSANNISSRTYSTAKVTWATQRWTTNERGSLQRTPDIKNLINEAITKDGRRASMAFVFSLGSATAGWANALSFDRSASTAPELVIEYTLSTSNTLSNIFINEATGSSSLNSKLDFIEIYNNNTTAVNLTNVYLTDDKTKPTLYNFNGKNLAAKSFLVVDADGDLTTSTETTAAFGISASSETLYLYQQVNGVLSILDSLVIGATTFNTSFGRLPNGSSTVKPFSQVTRGTSNNSAKELLPLTFSNQRGLYTAPFSLTIQAPAGTTIRYTTNNTTPTNTNGTVYANPLSISTSTVVRAYAYSSTGESKAITQSYVFPSSVSLQLAESNARVETALKELPIVSISTTDVSILTDTIKSENRKRCTFEYINKFGENKSVFVDAGIKLFGNASLTKPKKSFRLYFKGEYGYSKLKHKIFERLPFETYNPTDEFDQLDLRAGQDAASSNILSEYLSHGLLRKMGSKDVHVQYVNVFVNGAYYGLVPMREKFDNNYAASYYPGEDTDFDYLQTEDVQYEWPTEEKVYVEEGDGSLAQFQGVLAAVQNNDYQDLKAKLDVTHLTNTLLMFLPGSSEPEYKAIIGKNYSTPMTFNMKDMDTYIDDLATASYVFRLERNTTDNIKGPHDVFAMTGMGGGTPVLEYQTLARDRFQLVYLENNGVMTADSIRAFYRRGETIMQNSMRLEVARWNRYTLDSWFYRNNQALERLPERLVLVTNRFRQYNLIHTLRAVTLSKPSGNVNISEKIFITNPNPNTSVYYTLDGTDVVFNNAISPTARLYNATTGIQLPLGKVKLRARAYAANNFGMYADAEYTGIGSPNLSASLIFQVEGYQEGQKAVINWVSNANKQADYYIIEKKVGDKPGFERLQVINAQHTTENNALHYYTALDNMPEKDKIAYRVGMVQDGRPPQYSAPLTLDFSHFTDFAVYPNPATDNVVVDLSNVLNLPINVSIMDLMGKNIAKTSFDKAPNTASLDLSNIPAGTYFIRLQVKGKRDVMKKLAIIR
jgi:hypothetical protein